MSRAVEGEDISDGFWALVERADKSLERMRSILWELSEDEICDFHREYLLAVSVLEGSPFVEILTEKFRGMSEDGIEDIALWIVDQGRGPYEEVLEQPEKILNHAHESCPPSPRQVIAEVFEKKTGIPLSPATHDRAWPDCWPDWQAEAPDGTGAPGSMRNPVITMSLRGLKHPLEQEIETVRGIIIGAHPEIREGFWAGGPSFRYKGYFATFELRNRGTFWLVFHRGYKSRGMAANKTVADPTGLLMWMDEQRAIVKPGDAKDLPAWKPALQALVREWIRWF